MTGFSLRVVVRLGTPISLTHSDQSQKRPHHALADVHLCETLEGELGGIFNWAYMGYRRLIKQGFFTDTAEQKYLVKVLKLAGNPHMMFFEECADLTYDRNGLWNKYTEWAIINSLKPMNKGALYSQADMVMMKEYDKRKTTKGKKN